LIEQWKITYESARYNIFCWDSYCSPIRGDEVPTVYKKVVVMIRSLYSLIRILPAYKIFKYSLLRHHEPLSENLQRTKYWPQESLTNSTNIKRVALNIQVVYSTNLITNVEKASWFTFEPGILNISVDVTTKVPTPFGTMSLSVHYIAQQYLKVAKVIIVSLTK
jgi:hypothetical protein